MSPTEAPLLNFCGFIGKAHGDIIVGKSEVVIYTPLHQMITTLISHVWLRESRVATTMVRVTYSCIHGSGLPMIRISVDLLKWEYGVGINIYWRLQPVSAGK